MRSFNNLTRRLAHSAKHSIHPHTFSRNPIQVSIHSPLARTTSTRTPQLVYDTSLPQKPYMEDADWTRIVTSEHEVNGFPSLPWAVGIIAYRQCYRNCPISKWADFKTRFDELMMKQWEMDFDRGDDSRGMVDKWKLFWEEDERLEFLSFGELRERYDARTSVQGEIASNQCFLVVNDEILDSMLEGPAKGEIPFAFAVDPYYELDEEEADYKGQLRVAVELLPSFWCDAGPDDGRAMEKCRLLDDVVKKVFNTSLLG